MPKPEHDAAEHPGGALLGERSFTLADQHAFADFCGDRNPIHLDSVYARRTIAGDVVVHGVNAVLWALDLFVASGRGAPGGFSATFKKPIFLAERVECRLHEARKLISIWRDDARLVDIALQAGPAPAASAFTPAEAPRAAPMVRTEADLIDGAPAPLRLCGQSARASTLFPALSDALGAARVCDLGATSEIVGMQAPGLHSLYLTLKASFAAPNAAVAPNYRVDSFDPRFRIANLVVETPSLNAKLSALLRSPPADIAGLAEISGDIAPGEFKHVRALIVGGSRGLGEATAKIIARGGGAVAITYNVGVAEAQRLVDEINAAGGEGDAVQLDVSDEQSIAQLDLGAFNHLYYFATPKIFGKRGAAFDAELLERFRSFYVGAFSQLMERRRARGGKVAVFYPSTTAIDQPLPDLAEYIAAKREGEALCAALSNAPELEILWPRIPRTQTDQTAAVIAVAANDPVLVMAPFVREMAALTVAGSV